jgi:hypothetical protein
MTHGRVRFTIGIAALAALAACGGKSAPVQASDDLKRDLELASGQGIELLPNASRTTVVSAIEQTGTAEPAPAPTRVRTPTPKPRQAQPRQPRRVAPQPRPQARVVRAPAPAPERQVERPEPRPTYGADVISPPPPGGYKTVDEVIRNAPFPIKP